MQIARDYASFIPFRPVENERPKGTKERRLPRCKRRTAESQSRRSRWNGRVKETVGGEEGNEMGEENSETDRRENKRRGWRGQFCISASLLRRNTKEHLVSGSGETRITLFQRRRRFSKRRGGMITFSLVSFRAVQSLKRGSRRWGEWRKREREREREREEKKYLRWRTRWSPRIAERWPAREGWRIPVWRPHRHRVLFKFFNLITSVNATICRSRPTACREWLTRLPGRGFVAADASMTRASTNRCLLSFFFFSLVHLSFNLLRACFSFFLFHSHVLFPLVLVILFSRTRTRFARKAAERGWRVTFPWFPTSRERANLAAGNLNFPSPFRLSLSLSLPLESVSII